jgi:hypothetical protein
VVLPNEHAAGSDDDQKDVGDVEDRSIGERVIQRRLVAEHLAHRVGSRQSQVAVSVQLCHRLGQSHFRPFIAVGQTFPARSTPDDDGGLLGVADLSGF